MWVRHIYDFPFRLVRHLLRSVTVAFRATKIPTTLRADVPVIFGATKNLTAVQVYFPVDYSFQSYQNPDNFIS